MVRFFHFFRSSDAKENLSSAMLGSNIEVVKSASVSVVFLADRGTVHFLFCLILVLSFVLDLVCVFSLFLVPSRLTRDMMKLELEGGTDPGYVSSLPAKVSFLIGPGMLSKGIRKLASHLVSPLSASPRIELNSEIWSIKNASLFAQQVIMAATAYGISSAPMEGFDERRVKFQLGIPFDDYTIPMIVSLGYIDKNDSIGCLSYVNEPYDYKKGDFPKKRRFDLKKICYENQYGELPSFV
jgi:nitroreductase